MSIREAPCSLIELRRGDPEVEDGPTEVFDVCCAHGCLEAIEPGVHSTDSISEALQSLPRGDERRRITIDAEEVQVRVGVEQELGMPTTAQCRVEHDSRRNRRKHSDDLCPHHREVMKRCRFLLVVHVVPLFRAPLIGSPPVNDVAGMSPRSERDVSGRSGAAILFTGGLPMSGTHRYLICVCALSFRSASLLLGSWSCRQFSVRTRPGSRLVGGWASRVSIGACVGCVGAMCSSRRSPAHRLACCGRSARPNRSRCGRGDRGRSPDP